MSVATSSVKQAINAKEPVKSLWDNPTGQLVLAFTTGRYRGFNVPSRVCQQICLFAPQRLSMESIASELRVALLTRR